MEILVTFPGGMRVDAQAGPHLIRTDQPASAGGDASAPAPFDLFLASLATCAGYYVLAFCRARGIPTAGLTLVEHAGPGAIDLELRLPTGFPDHYRDAVMRAAEVCKVKKLLAHPPVITIKEVSDVSSRDL